MIVIWSIALITQMWKLFLCFDQYKAYGKHSTTLDAW
jgi:hypothetical protein